jgi:hypothetical protein
MGAIADLGRQDPMVLPANDAVELANRLSGLDE